MIRRQEIVEDTDILQNHFAQACFCENLVGRAAEVGWIHARGRDYGEPSLRAVTESVLRVSFANKQVFVSQTDNNRIWI